MAFSIRLVLGEDRDVYESMIASLPAGQDNLVRGLTVPSHVLSQPLTFEISGVTPDESHYFMVVGEWNKAPIETTYFVPNSETYLITVPLPYGPVTVVVKSATEEGQFILAVTHFAVIIRTFASQITEYSVLPLRQLAESIENPLAYRLSLPVLNDASTLMPSDLEAFQALSHRFLVKNKLDRPGTEGDIEETLAAFCASTPYFFKMADLGRLDAPLYRSEELFSGHEAHAWMPNREVERWKAFYTLLGNLPQLFTVREILEGEVVFEAGGKLRRHYFDFDSPLANSVLDVIGASQCFLNLFKLSVTVEAEHFLAFCQASYGFDNFISEPGLVSPDVDPLGITNWKTFSLTGRFEQQLDISHNVHAWRWDSPVIGTVDGINRFFNLTGLPSSPQALKVFVDGLLQRLNIDYRLGAGTDIRSGALPLTNPVDPLYLPISIGASRSILAPVFSTIEVDGNTDLEMIITAGPQSYSSVSFIISHPPGVPAPADPQAISLHYVTPDRPAVDYTGLNQYGVDALTIGTLIYTLTFPTPAVSIDYQVFVQVEVDPMPSGDPAAVSQVIALVKTRSLSGVVVEFSEPIVDANSKLNWWLIEQDGVALERGTILIPAGDASVPVVFTGGPYLDPPVVIMQLWTTDGLGNVPLFLNSMKQVTAAGTIAQLSEATPSGSDYRIDYVVFSAQSGGQLEFFAPPAAGAEVEAHYDELWLYWANTSLAPMPDGVRTEFTLPIPLAKPESLYLTLNRRLMLQGNNLQYVVGDDLQTIRFTFPPDPAQEIWAVYPLPSPFTDELPSEWSQRKLISRPARQPGTNATGSVEFSTPAIPGEVITVGGVEFLAVETAKGIVVNGGKITTGDALNFAPLGVTLTAAPIPSGENEFANNVDRDTDGAALSGAINAHSVLGGLYYASHSAGVLSIFALNIGGGSYDQTLTVFGSSMTVASSIVGDSASSSGSKAQFTVTGDAFSFIPADVVIGTDRITIANHPYYDTEAVRFTSTGILPAPLSNLVTYYVTNATANDFQLSTSITGSPIVDLTSIGTGFHLIRSHPVNVDGNYFHTEAHTFNALEPVQFLSVDNMFALPAPFAAGTIYYVVDEGPSAIRLSSTADGLSPVSLVDEGQAGAVFLIKSFPHFAATGVDSIADAEAFAASVSFEMEYNAALAGDDKTVNIVAPQEGPDWDAPIVTARPHADIKGGKFRVVDPSYRTYKPFYNEPAPVVSIDGLATRRLREYSGNEIVFDTRPIPLQEPYSISEVFPVDNHPLDSMVANAPCSYPKGVFTQGLFSQLTELDLVIEVDGSGGAITVNGLPYQEEPQGVKDGVNTVFTLSLGSCAGSQSLLLWVDGLFQPPDTWSYSEILGQGILTLSFAPINAQKLWVFYLPEGDGCPDERVAQPVGAIDGVNQNYTITDSPWVDAPTFTLFLEGVFQLQNTDYVVDPGNASISYLGLLAPATGQSLWAHYNLGVLEPGIRWRQLRLGTADGITSNYTIPTFISAELPTSPNAVILFLDGIAQRRGVDFEVDLDFVGSPDGGITFLGGAPEVGRLIDVAYIRVG